MSTRKLKFHILDVFTTTRYLGNPLAIVHVPASESQNLTQEQKLQIAREFNLSETVFLHENLPGATSDGGHVRIDIFTPKEELSFAGHPTIGSSWFVLTSTERDGGNRREVTLQTKAGNIPAVLRESGRVRLQVPIDFKAHKPIPIPSFKSAQSNLRAGDYANGLDGAEGVASVVKGTTFVLLELTSEDALKRVQGVDMTLDVPWLEDWKGRSVGLYTFYEREDGVVRTRMMRGTFEDAATGSAASTLGGWLGKRKGPGKWVIEMVQGVEMGRRSEIEVRVQVDNDGGIQGIELGGEAVHVAEGFINV
ncbi:hypothetical protein D9756_007073 [Leucocoprinus leucothites]|uniref:Diaminopimelate epimerase-like protein n=1 Tax=Leucocoprinus leucothites TaxID=201217 RepID=A0A8H5D5K2_9AGAR|nr:hypothetical protein D9756_007073 [Leucoagaricus leucothites]